MRQQIASVCCAMLIVLSCGAAMAQTTPEATESPETPELTGVTWQWRQYMDSLQKIDAPNPNYTLTFRDNGKFYARVEGNYLNGTYVVEGDSMTISLDDMTLTACPSDLTSGAFICSLGELTTFSFTDDGELALEAPIYNGTMLFIAQPQITGAVTYRPRIALPPDAIVRVQLQDVSIADAPTIILGEDVIQTEGAQVPIPFAVSYPESVIQDDRRYSLAARVTDAEGRLLFISDTYIPVLTDDHPTSDIEIVVIPVS